MKKVAYFNITYRCNSSCLFCAAATGESMDLPDLSVDAINRALDDQGVAVGDRIIINGGEPTVHPDLLNILAAARRRGAYIDLFTNGVRLADASFAEAICSYEPIRIRIPIFGATSAIHDELVCHKGGFEKILQAFDNILKLRSPNVSLEIKLLLCKATKNENIKIAQLLEGTLRGSYTYSLNPLLVSKRGLENSSLVLESLNSAILANLPVIDFLVAKNRVVSLGLLPYCAVPSKYWAMISNTRKTIKQNTYVDVNSNRSYAHELSSSKCAACYFAEACPGYPRSYLEHFGDHEILPFGALPEHLLT